MSVKIYRAEFVTSVFRLSRLPDSGIPEIAFAGKSNVGKSSLLNRIIGRHNLVKVSSRPGFTQSLNFFLINDSVHFVDLPGYGFAKAPKNIQKKWQKLIEGYLENGRYLKGVVCIFDMRRLPEQQDLALLDYLHSLGIRAWVVLNKADKISQPRRQAQLNAICRRLPGFTASPVVVSARTGEGAQDLLNKIWQELGLDV
ncbi:MAG TPA: YihA family ribosome biogenesis GTP-binding protein [Thermodesulfobacteriaceae bacterium]|nr:YihA family ribosome biogenesis GTP-binding protein [Thermodesulfobacteriaceae bacterium]